MNRNQFERIFSRMAQEYGKIERYEEDPYVHVFFAIESNVLRVHREHPSSNSRRMIEALALALYDIKGRIENEEIDTSAFRNEDNERLEHAILMAIDPFTNEEAMEAINSSEETKEQFDLTTPEGLRALYETAVKCMIRLKDSVETWIEIGGADGYFDYIESQLGPAVTGDGMSFTLTSPILYEEPKPLESMRRHRRRVRRL